MQQYGMVLSEHESNVEALFRRGKAKSKLGQTGKQNQPGKTS
uniref:Uncharacterized protein n=1 Tax=Arundo donax TaxID=35708 RepID=A0A0A9GPA7_ARUDO